MVIHKTERHGVSYACTSLELGECGAREKARERLNPGLKAHSAVTTEGAPAVTIAWLSPLSHPRSSVSFRTIRAGDPWS